MLNYGTFSSSATATLTSRLSHSHTMLFLGFTIFITAMYILREFFAFCCGCLCQGGGDAAVAVIEEDSEEEEQASPESSDEEEDGEFEIKPEDIPGSSASDDEMESVTESIVVQLQ